MSAVAAVRELREIEYNIRFFAEELWPELLNHLAHGSPSHRTSVFDGALEHCKELTDGIQRLRALIEKEEL